MLRNDILTDSEWHATNKTLSTLFSMPLKRRDEFDVRNARIRIGLYMEAGPNALSWAWWKDYEISVGSTTII